MQPPAAPLPSRPAQVRGTAARPNVVPAPPAAAAPVAPEQVAQADDYRAIRPGDQVTGAWSHPFYQLDPVQYGLAIPAPGARWIRYMDGALLVDPSGRVMETRWDLAGPVATNLPADAVPAYAGAGNYRPTAADYGRVQPGNAYLVPGPPAMMVIETTTTTTRGDPQR